MNFKSCFLLMAFGCVSIGSLSAQVKDTGVSAREIWIESGRRRIYGVLSKPAGNGEKQPVAIVAHGFNGTHDFGKNYFKTFNDMGYQCFTFDFPCGSVNSRSDHNTMEMSVVDEQQYLEAVVGYFQLQPDVDAARIVLVGESQGGLISSLVAANPAMNIHRLILVFPALSIPENWNARYSRIADIPDTTRLWNVPLGRRFFTELRYMDPMALIGKFAKPVLIVHGDSDRVVPVDYSHRAVKVYNNARLVVLQGEGHGFKPQGFKRLLLEIEKFLDGK